MSHKHVRFTSLVLLHKHPNTLFLATQARITLEPEALNQPCRDASSDAKHTLSDIISFSWSLTKMPCIVGNNGLSRGSHAMQRYNMSALKPQGAGYIRQSNTRVASLLHKTSLSVPHRRHCGRRMKYTSPVAAQPERPGKDWKQSLWTAVDLTASLGSVGGAIAFVLTQEAMLVGLPVVLPLLALYASRKREEIAREVSQPFYSAWHTVVNKEAVLQAVFNHWVLSDLYAHQ